MHSVETEMKTEEDVYDVIIVGAGPCGLACAARLCEGTPAALFTDEEHRRYNWIGKHGNKMAIKQVRSGKEMPAKGHAPAKYRMVVLDATSDKWLGRWNRLFKTYDISHLRSHMLWHVDPLDRDSLLGYTWAEDREDEIIEMKNCVGKEMSKHAHKKKTGSRFTGKKQDARVAINLRDHTDYYRPSISLFSDHCQSVARRYKLESLLRQENMMDIDYSVVNGVSIDDEKLFTVTTDSTRRFAKAVVLAVGPANKAKIPRLPSMTAIGDAAPKQTCHSMHIRTFPDPMVQSRINAGRITNVLVVGGGLTSAQLSDLAIRRGVTKIWHLMRSRCRVKHFDVDLQWMGKYRNAEQARFWSADSDEERLEIIKEARGGGSLTPFFMKRVKEHVASGKLELHEQTCLEDAKFVEKDDDGGGVWEVTTNPPIQGLPAFDFIYFATGIQTDYATLPYLQKVMEKHPLQGYGGFPCINDDLMWAEDVPLYLTGRLAALRLGPAAPNIGGAKLGAERIAWAMEDFLASSNQEAGYEGITGYLSGHGNMYSALGEE